MLMTQNMMIPFLTYKGSYIQNHMRYRYRECVVSHVFPFYGNKCRTCRKM